MAVVDADLVWTYSSAGASEGGSQTATVIPDAVDENLFADVTDVTRIAGWTAIHKLFLGNEASVDDLPPHSLWEYASPTGCTLSLGLGVNSADDADATAGALTNLAAAAKVALISNGSDTRTVTVRGKDAAGDPLDEDVVLDGTNEVLSVATFSSFYLVAADALSASRTVTIKEGTGGTTRGTIPPNLLCCFRWITGATAKATGIHLTAMPPSSEIPIWIRIVGPPDVAAGTRSPALRVQTL